MYSTVKEDVTVIHQRSGAVSTGRWAETLVLKTEIQIYTGLHTSAYMYVYVRVCVCMYLCVKGGRRCMRAHVYFLKINVTQKANSKDI